jgi:large subunit ribosomal protein L9
MKVLLKKTILKLGRIGDVVDVKDGYARNYLLPHDLAMEPTEGNLRAIEADKQKYLEELARLQEQFQAKADLIDGKELSMVVKANDDGHLYGSIGPAQIAAALAEDGALIDAEYVKIAEPFREVGEYDIEVVFAEEIRSKMHLAIVAEGSEKEAEEVPEAPAEDASEDTPADEATNEAAAADAADDAGE